MPTERQRGKRTERVFVSVAVVVVIAAAIVGRSWPFNSRPQDVGGVESPSVWQYLLGDRLTLGFARLGLVVAVLFLLASLVALARAGRWMSGIGGLTVDERESADERVENLETQLQATQAALDDEAKKRQEAEDWADGLIDELDGTRIELEQANETLAAWSNDDDANAGGDSPSA